MRRRHLHESQRAMVAAKLANMSEGRPKETGQIRPVSKDQAAETMGVGRTSVTHARKVQSKGDPELVKAVEQGKVTVSAAAKMTDLPPEDQRRMAAAKNPAFW